MLRDTRRGRGLTYIRCGYDGYEGWCTAAHLTEIDADYAQGGHALTPEWVNELEYNGQPMMVPLGSSLAAMRNGHADWRKNKLHYKGKPWDPAAARPDPRMIRQLAYKFLNTPYLWGGKSVFGVDCSGFTHRRY